MLLNMSATTLVATIAILLISFPVHEFAHAWTATRFGDPTPEMNGRLTLNPLAHIDLLGAAMLLMMGFGWAKPVPINPYILQRRSPSAVMWVSLAGPMSNFLLAVLGAIPFRLGLLSIDDAYRASSLNISGIVMWFVTINLILMLFNLFPLAPLDGDKILEYFLPPKISEYIQIIRPYGPIILLALVALGNLGRVNILWKFIEPPLLLLQRLLLG